MEPGFVGVLFQLLPLRWNGERALSVFTTQLERPKINRRDVEIRKNGWHLEHTENI